MARVDIPSLMAMFSAVRFATMAFKALFSALMALISMLRFDEVEFK
jgi:hypothetical protein